MFAALYLHYCILDNPVQQATLISAVVTFRGASRKSTPVKDMTEDPRDTGSQLSIICTEAVFEASAWSVWLMTYWCLGGSVGLNVSVYREIFYRDRYNKDPTLP